MRGECFVKARRSRRTGPARVDQKQSSAFRSHPNYSRLHTRKQTVYVGRGDMERKGEKLELSEPELKIYFC